MDWMDYVAWFLGGAFLANAMPHFVSGVTGRAFQTPFARPPGKGLSSSVVNVSWGSLNLVFAWLLLCRVGDFVPRSIPDALAVGSGMVLMGVVLARTFGPLHGGRA
jgi:hypothetical protein